MTQDSIVSFNVKDITSIAVRCRGCGSSVSFLLDREFPADRDIYCGGCPQDGAHIVWTRDGENTDKALIRAIFRARAQTPESGVVLGMRGSG